jgi:hypothetical protein
LNSAAYGSILLASITLSAAGALKTRVAGGRWYVSAAEFLILGMLAVVVGYLVGILVGGFSRSSREEGARRGVYPGRVIRRNSEAPKGKGVKIGFLQSKARAACIARLNNNSSVFARRMLGVD